MSNNSGKRLGLLERANLATQSSAKTDIVLDESMSLAEKAFVGFHQFANNFNLKKAAVFVRQKDTYALTISHNIEKETLQNPEIPALFWEAMYFSKYNEETWLTFTDDQMRSFLTLFSQPEQSCTDSIILKTFAYNDKKMILCILKSSESNFPLFFEELETKFKSILPFIYESQLSGTKNTREKNVLERTSTSLTDEKSAHILRIILSDAFKNLNKGLTDVDKYVLYNSIHNELNLLIGRHNICISSEEFIFSLAFFTKGVFPGNMYYELIKEKLLPYFSLEELLSIHVQDKGSTSSEPDLVDLLTRKM